MPITYKGGSNNPEKRTTMQYSQQRFKGLKGKIFREIHDDFYNNQWRNFALGPMQLIPETYLSVADLGSKKKSGPATACKWNR